MADRYAEAGAKAKAQAKYDAALKLYGIQIYPLTPEPSPPAILPTNPAVAFSRAQDSLRRAANWPADPIVGLVPDQFETVESYVSFLKKNRAADAAQAIAYYEGMLRAP